METCGGDRRTRKTKQQLRQSLTELLAEKPLSKITVRELTERADVNRATFYGHYKDIYDMKDQIERELFEEFVSVIDGYTPDTMRQGLKPILTDVFRFLQRNAAFGLVLMESKTDSPFLSWVREEIYRRGLQEWRPLYGFQESARWDYYLDFVVAGSVAMFFSWMKKGMRETPEEMAALAERFILTGPEPLDQPET